MIPTLLAAVALGAPLDDPDALLAARAARDAGGPVILGGSARDPLTLASMVAEATAGGQVLNPTLAGTLKPELLALW